MTESTQQANFENLLAQSRELVCAELGAAMRMMLDKADEALSALSSASRGGDGAWLETMVAQLPSHG